MPIKVSCPRCGKSLTVPDSEGGLAALCNACGQRLVIPMPAAESAGVMRLPTFEEAASRAAAEKVERPAVPVGAVSEGRVQGAAEDGGAGSGRHTSWVLLAAMIGVSLIVGAAVSVIATRPSAWERKHRA